MDGIFEDGVGSKRNIILVDKDYEEHNKTYNRVKNYSFVR